MFGVGDFWLETRVIIKISTHPCYQSNFDWLSWGWSKKNFKLADSKKNSKLADSKKQSFSKPPILNIFLQKFQKLVLGLIDAKGINFAQPIWSSGCQSEGEFTAENTKNAVLKNAVLLSRPFWNFFFCFMKICRNFDDYTDFQPKITHPKHVWPECT